MNRESYLLRQRHQKPADITHLVSDEQETVIAELASEAESQATFFMVRVVVSEDCSEL